MPKSRSRTADERSPSKTAPRKANAQSSKRPNQREQSSREFAVLKPRVRKIPQATITAKWTPLSQDAQQHVRDTMKTAKRSVIMSHWDERRRAEADVAINTAVKKIEKRLPRMRFPPKTKDIFFDFDKLAENSRLLENQLTSALHAVELLKAEIRKEEDAVLEDQNRLAELQANARAEYKEQSKRASKTHPLLQVTQVGKAEDTADAIRPREPKGKDTEDLADADPDIASLFQQFSSHLNGIRTNQTQVHGLLDAMLEAQNELDCVLPQNDISEGLG